MDILFRLVMGLYIYWEGSIAGVWIYIFAFDLFVWVGFGVGRSERVLLQEARYHHPPGSWRGNRFEEGKKRIIYSREKRKTYPYIHKVPCRFAKLLSLSAFSQSTHPRQ